MEELPAAAVLTLELSPSQPSSCTGNSGKTCGKVSGLSVPPGELWGGRSLLARPAQFLPSGAPMEAVPLRDDRESN